MNSPSSILKCANGFVRVLTRNAQTFKHHACTGTQKHTHPNLCLQREQQRSMEKSSDTAAMTTLVPVYKNDSSLLFMHLPAALPVSGTHVFQPCSGQNHGIQEWKHCSHWHFICPGTPMCCGCLWRCYDWKSSITEAHLHSMFLSSCNTQQAEKEVLLSKVNLKCLSVLLFRPRANKFPY